MKKGESETRFISQQQRKVGVACGGCDCLVDDRQQNAMQRHKAPLDRLATVNSLKLNSQSGHHYHCFLLHTTSMPLVASGKSCAYAVEETLSAPLGHKRTGRVDALAHLPSHNPFFLFFPVPTSLLLSFSSNAVITILLLPLRPRLPLHERSAKSSDITKP
jgi:hypothetical protein